MRMLKPLAVLAALALAVGSSMAQTQTRPPDTPSLLEGINKLLRMDLLERPQEEMIPPRRNIFAPGAKLSRPEDMAVQQSQQWAPDDHDVETPVPAAELIAAPPLWTVNLRYIGFIESSRRMIALVVFEGQAVAVVEGEVVGEGMRIGKITREQVEVVLPDSSTRLFSLEGE
ncbi:MAG: hypothetical protein WBC70_12890 [Candidatus Aminicenantales bacterium]